MALATSARRDQRRRLVASWNRSAVPVAGADEREVAAGDAAAYEDAAHPERHPGLATRLPTTLGGLVLASIVILGGMGAAIALAISGPLFGRHLIEGGGRFAATLAVVKQAIDPRVPLPLHSWLAVLALFLTAAVSGSIKLMRRHRRDDYNGRFRAWGWLSAILTLAAWAAIVPIGALISAVTSEATGITLGPGGIGWWYALAAITLMAILPWAILPLRHRAGAAAWTVFGMLGWTAAAAMSMPMAAGSVGGQDRATIIADAAWAGGAACLLVALLTAARGVIREVRGEVALVRPAKKRRERPRKSVAPQPIKATDDRDDEQADADESSSESESESESDDQSPSDWGDSSDGGQRRMSKSERRRLKKLARTSGHAA
jgi:hypothetical protein